MRILSSERKMVNVECRQTSFWRCCQDSIGKSHMMDVSVWGCGCLFCILNTHPHTHPLHTVRDDMCESNLLGNLIMKTLTFSLDKIITEVVLVVDQYYYISNQCRVCTKCLFRLSTFCIHRIGAISAIGDSANYFCQSRW
jgi:hypothetical protein